MYIALRVISSLREILERVRLGTDLCGNMGRSDPVLRDSLKEEAYLAHEVRDNAVKGAILVAEALLVGAQSPEVFCSLGYNITTKKHDQGGGNVATGKCGTTDTLNVTTTTT